LSSKSRLAAREKRRRIFTILGAHCRGCGSEQNLTLDCIRAVPQKKHGQGFIARQWFYWQQFRLGNIQVLCNACQSLKSNRSQEDFERLINSVPSQASNVISIKGGEQLEQLRKSVTPREFGGFAA